MIYKGIVLCICFLHFSSNADDTRSLFDDLIIEKKLDIEGQPSIYDTSAGSPSAFDSSTRSKCTRPPCQNLRFQKTVITPRPNAGVETSRNQSLFDDLPHFSSSLKGIKDADADADADDTSQIRQTNNHRKHDLESETTKRKTSGSLFDRIATTKARPGETSLVSKVVPSRTRHGWGPNATTQAKHSGTSLFSEVVPLRTHNNFAKDVDQKLAILQKEREAIENLPDTIWKQALKKSEQSNERESSVKVLNLFADSAKRFAPAYDRGNNNNNDWFTNSNTLPLNGQIIQSDSDLETASSVVNRQPSNYHQNDPNFPVKEDFAFIESVKEQRVSDLMLALKIMQVIDSSKSQQVNDKENDDEMELLLAKSLFKRSLNTVHDLSSPQRNFLNSVIKAMHGTLKKEEREVVADSISRIFTHSENDYDSGASNRRTYPRPATARPTPPVRPPRPPQPPPLPVGPPSPPVSPSPVGPPSPPVRPTTVGPPSPPVRPPNPPRSNPLRDDGNELSSEGFFITESDSSQLPDDAIFLAPNQEQFFVTGDTRVFESVSDENVWTPVLQPQLPLESEEYVDPESSQENVVRDYSQDIRSDDTSETRENSPVYNYHYHYFSDPAAGKDTSSSQRTDTSTRSLSIPQSDSSEERLRSERFDFDGQQSSYASLRTESRSRSPVPQIQRTPATSLAFPRPVSNYGVPVADPVPTGYRAPVRDPVPMDYRAPVADPVPTGYKAPARDPVPMDYRAPVRDPVPTGYRTPVRDPVPTNYRAPVADIPSNTYGPPPPRNPPVRVPRPRDPPPVRTRLVFLQPNRFKGKGHKGKNGGFSAFSVLLDENGSNRFRDAPQFDDFSSDFIFQRDSLRDDYWRSRELLYRQQQQAFELERLQDEIELQERHREELKKGLFKSMFKKGYGGGIKDMFYKGAMALGAMSLVPLHTIFGRKRRSLDDLPNDLHDTKNLKQMVDIFDRNFAEPTSKFPYTKNTKNTKKKNKNSAKKSFLPYKARYN